MHLNLYTDIGLKTIIYLKNSNELVTLTEISKQFNIPRNHLVKVANHLVKLSWIIAVRGRNGGLKYNPATDNLKLGDVIIMLEGENELLGCDTDLCKLRNACNLRKALNRALHAFYAELNSIKIADITSGETAALVVQIKNHYYLQQN